jgi:hypothetical protein
VSKGARYAAQQDRDQAQDRHYTINLDGHRSVLAYVDERRDALVAEFWAWVRAEGRRGGVNELDEWEVLKFGDKLFPTADGILRSAAWKSLQRVSRPSLAPREPDPERQPFKDPEDADVPF